MPDREFRGDLYYRLNVIHVRIPPLRERQEDIPALLDHFLRHFAGVYRVEQPTLPPDTRALLSDRDWPGNVRELMNFVEQLTVRFAGRRVPPTELPSGVNGPADGEGSEPGSASGASWRAAEARVLFNRIVQGGGSFWSTVYEPFMARDLTREHVRALVKLGLEQTRGSYKALVQYLHMPPSDYKRFLNFLRKHQCQVPFQGWRAMPVYAGSPGERRGGKLADPAACAVNRADPRPAHSTVTLLARLRG